MVQYDFLVVRNDFLMVHYDFWAVQYDFPAVQYDFLVVRNNFLVVRNDFLVVQCDFLAVQYGFLVVQYHFWAVQNRFSAWIMSLLRDSGLPPNGWRRRICSTAFRRRQSTRGGRRLGRSGWGGGCWGFYRGWAYACTLVMCCVKKNV